MTKKFAWPGYPTKSVSSFPNGSIFRALIPQPINFMLIKIGFDIEFELSGPTPMILMLSYYLEES